MLLAHRGPVKSTRFANGPQLSGQAATAPNQHFGNGPWDNGCEELAGGTRRTPSRGSGSIGTKSLQFAVSATAKPVEWAFPGRAPKGRGGAPVGQSGS